MSDEYGKTPKVVTVLDEYKIVINRGLDHGIKPGDLFLVFSLGEKISDPDTGEDLGVLEIVRGRAKADHVQEKFSTLISNEFEVTTGPKRTIRRKEFGYMLLGNGDTVEEVEEVRDSTRLTIEAVVGDYARPI
ncbi:hypothetical protein [Brucella grignonensis]|uniref:hypothetical protein n=1 Tax=Brucella grignonensis TaxID=94627 RepID=UPI000B98C02D|nr:hypothetical protein [Brucella grignonensis]NKB83077.1 hypothetical protein [Brucella grignonensis]